MNQTTEQTQTRRSEEESAGRLPPSDLQAEQAVLGAIMLSEEAFARVHQYVREDSFYWKKHAVIYRAMIKLFNESEPVDVVTVSEKLKSEEKLEQVGGSFYLTELTEAVPFPSNIEYYAKIVQDKFLLRTLRDIGEGIGSKSLEPATEPSGLIETSLEKLFSLQQNNEKAGYKPLYDISMETLKDIDILTKHKGELTGVGSGYKALDKMTGGFQPSDLIILAARPSMGKTALALSFAWNAAKISKVPVGIISLEMNAKQIAMRLLAFETKLSLTKIRTGNLKDKEHGRDSEYGRISKACGSLSELPIFIDDSSTQTIVDIRARARRLRTQHDVGMIVLDYLQLMQPSDRIESQQQFIASVSRQLKGLAKDLNVPVIALSQLSRAVETRAGSMKPILSDLRDSGAIEQDADVVIFVYRQAYYDRLQGKHELADYEPDNTAEVIIGKQRNGPTGTVKLTFLDQCTLFQEQERELNEQPPPPQREREAAPF